MKAKLVGFIALLFLFGLAEEARANPIDVSYTVSGSSGNWVYDFSFTNNLGGVSEIYSVGVRLTNPVASSIVYPSGWFAGSPGGWNWSIYGGSNTDYNVLWVTCPSASCPTGYPINNIEPGQTLSGFQVTDTNANSVTSVSWYAVTVGYYAPPQTGCSFICGAPYTNPGFEGLAAPAISETPLPATLPLFAAGLGALGLLGWRRKRKAALKWAAVLGVISFAANGTVNAATLTFSHSTPSSSIPISDSFNLQLFDTTLGTLTAVDIFFSATATQEVRVFNASFSTLPFTNAFSSTTLTLTAPAGANVALTSSYTVSSGTATGPFFYTSFMGSPTNLSNSLSILLADFAAYQGVGTVYGAFAIADTSSTFSGNGLGLTFGGSLVSAESVTIQYTYDLPSVATPVPAALPLFATGLGALGLLGGRRRRKAAALAA